MSEWKKSHGMTIQIKPLCQYFDMALFVFQLLKKGEIVVELWFWLILAVRYPARGGFSLAWLLAFTKSFAGLVCRVVGLFTPYKTNQLRDRQATRTTSLTLKAMRERNFCSQGSSGGV